MAKSRDMVTFDASYLGHTSNLAQKVRRAPRELAHVIDSVRREHEQFIEGLLDLGGDLTAEVTALNSYVEVAKALERKHTFFNWRSDFAGSIIPEFLYRLLAHNFHVRGIPALFSTRDSVVELTLSGALAGGWNIRRKNQDLAVGLRRARVVQGDEEQTFVVPIVVFEVKTNIDKNKLNGLEFSADRLKRTFPGSKYVLVTETVDFSLSDNYASGAIDEIYVLRKQLRKDARKRRAPLCAEVFAAFALDVCTFVQLMAQDQGHVYRRLAAGKLIHGI